MSRIIFHSNDEKGVFDAMSDDEFEAHMAQDQYGDFFLTEAIRPSPHFAPKEGFVEGQYKNDSTKIKTPTLMISASREKLFDLFQDLVDELSSNVGVVLETSHMPGIKDHDDIYRYSMDLPVLRSTLYDFEELLLHDGCTGIAVFDDASREEIAFDAHKLIYVYSQTLDRFRRVLESHGVEEGSSGMRFITDKQFGHIHVSNVEHQEAFDQLALRLVTDEHDEDFEDDKTGEEWKNGRVD
jgi:hypothetical protein